MAKHPNAFRFHKIGNPSTIPGWPTNDFAGALDALSRWTPEPRLDPSGYPTLPEHKGTPFCTAAPMYLYGGQGWNSEACCTTFLSRPELAHPEHPNAVNFLLNFVGYSFVINITTDDPEEIAELQAAIDAAMRKPDYREEAVKRSAALARRYGAGWKGWPEGHPCHGLDAHVLSTVTPTKQRPF